MHEFTKIEKTMLPTGSRRYQIQKTLSLSSQLEDSKHKQISKCPACAMFQKSRLWLKASDVLNQTYAGKSRSSSFYVLNMGGLLLVLSIVGGTLRFMVISVTLVSWLQTQWLAYTSFLKKRHTARLAAAAEKDRSRQRKQIADITEAVGENMISLLDKRRQELKLKLDHEAEMKRRNYQQDIVTRITGHLADFQESERVKDEQRLKVREDGISRKERELKAREESLNALQKRLEDSERKLRVRQKSLKEREKDIEDEERDLEAKQKNLEDREKKAKATEDKVQKLQLKQEELKIQHRVVNQRTTAITTPNSNISSPTSLPNNSVNLPSDLMQYAEDLNSFHFTCIGITKRGTRCGQSMISSADKSAASRRIAKMKSPDPGDCTTLYEINALRELADWMLCPRWHRDKLPQGAEIARRWYGQLRDAREVKAKAVNTWKTPSSAGVPSLFGSTGTRNNSTGTTASSFGSSVQSMSASYTGSDFQFTSPQGAATAAISRQSLFGHSAAQHLTPVFEFMAEHPSVTKKGFGQWE
ncbi:hypothetical protein TSTA_046080 [Talaromyces stipitatus ATCC 10500]|uniref:Uncharacterized protein n=1 Tax=Talaromyces stipitatus (strain ATCC 10500 / CBS 375.48 / QM 6759 / NRRL 1006) TaxID=441959 RepID=B8MJF4_TALSN|nr:uncharacterized protein TSTA_046080 [Talaromyces stipitatus ATCC 10500]EED15154.1 hypothetical protein TSTA_046080 [Talaromyces stipitatus ATCC 10500]